MIRGINALLLLLEVELGKPQRPQQMEPAISRLILKINSFRFVAVGLRHNGLRRRSVGNPITGIGQIKLANQLGIRDTRGEVGTVVARAHHQFVAAAKRFDSGAQVGIQRAFPNACWQVKLEYWINRGCCRIRPKQLRKYEAAVVAYLAFVILGGNAQPRIVVNLVPEFGSGRAILDGGVRLPAAGTRESVAVNLPTQCLSGGQAGKFELAAILILATQQELGLRR